MRGERNPGVRFAAGGIGQARANVLVGQIGEIIPEAVEPGGEFSDRPNLTSGLFC